MRVVGLVAATSVAILGGVGPSNAASSGTTPAAAAEVGSRKKRDSEVSLSGELLIEQIMTLMFWRVNSNHSPSERQMRISPETGIGVPAATPGTCKYHFQ